MEELLKTINEVEVETGISAFTIRYYDKCGFLPGIARNSQKRRRFSQQNIDRLLLVDALLKSGLSIDGLKSIMPALNADTYSDELYQLIQTKLTTIDVKIEELNICKERLLNYAADILFKQNYANFAESNELDV